MPANQTPLDRIGKSLVLLLLSERFPTCISKLGGGGGGVLAHIMVGMGRGKVRNRPGLRNKLHGRAWKCGAPERAWAVLSVKLGGSEPNLSRFERENAGLRNCQDASGWYPGRSLTRAAERFAFGLSRPCMGGGERVEIIEILKMMVSGTAKM